MHRRWVGVAAMAAGGAMCVGMIASPANAAANPLPGPKAFELFNPATTAPINMAVAGVPNSGCALGDSCIARGMLDGVRVSVLLESAGRTATLADAQARTKAARTQTTAKWLAGGHALTWRKLNVGVRNIVAQGTSFHAKGTPVYFFVTVRRGKAVAFVTGYAMPKYAVTLRELAIPVARVLAKSPKLPTLKGAVVVSKFPF